MHSDRCGSTHRQKFRAQGSEEFRYRDTMNLEPEMCDYTSYNWSQSKSNEDLKEKRGSCTRKTFDRFTTADSYAWKITQYGKYCSAKLEA
jgi:hypothetical protein